VALMVAIYLAFTVAYPAIALPILRNGPLSLTPLFPSPFFGLFIPTIYVDQGGNRQPQNFYDPIGWCVSFVLIAGSAVVLRSIALRLFDRGLGRVVDRSIPRPTPKKQPTEVDLIADPTV